MIKKDLSSSIERMDRMEERLGITLFGLSAFAEIHNGENVRTGSAGRAAPYTSVQPATLRVCPKAF